MSDEVTVTVLGDAASVQRVLDQLALFSRRVADAFEPYRAHPDARKGH